MVRLEADVLIPKSDETCDHQRSAGQQRDGKRYLSTDQSFSHSLLTWTAGS